MNELIEINIGNEPIEIELPGGARGLKGEIGSQGPVGPQGPQGLQGPQGIKGDTGEKGADGQDGISPVITTEQTPTGATITITDAQGTNTVTLTNGAKGDKGDQGDRGLQGEQGIQGIQGEKGETGSQGPQGPQGTPFIIKKTYQSIAEMQTDFNNMEENDYVMIASSVEIEDNAKLYMRGSSQWIFISDFSGATGIQGEQGPQGIQGPQGEQGPQGIQGIQGVQGEQGIQGYSIGSVAKTSGTSTPGTTDTYTMYLDDTNNTPAGTFNVYNGEDGCTIDDEVTSSTKTWSSAKINEDATVTEKGKEFTIESIEAPLADLKIYGDTEQDSIPTPSIPVEVESVTGKQYININNNMYELDLGNIELCKIGNYQDYIYKDSGKWYKYKVIEKIILDENTIFTTDSVPTNNPRRFITTYQGKILAPPDNNTKAQAFSNVGIVTATDTALATNSGVAIHPIGNIYIDGDTYSNITNTNVILYAILTIPIVEEITNTTLISQLEAVSTIDGTNNITVTSSGVVPDIEVTAYTNSFNGNIEYLYKKSADLSSSVGDISTVLSNLVTVGGGS